MKRSLLTALAALGMAGSMNAQGQDDVTVILGNLSNTVTTLTDGLENVSDTFNNTGSFEATHSALQDEIISTGVALVEGSPTLGVLAANGGYPMTAFLDPGRTVGRIAARLLDDPSVESFQANVLGPGDLNTIARNLAEAPDRLYQGYTEELFPGFEIEREGIVAWGVEPLLNEGSLYSLLQRVDGTGTPNVYERVLDDGLLRDTALGSSDMGFRLNLFVWVTRTGAFSTLFGDDAFGESETLQSVDETLQPLLSDTLVPAANQSVLGQPTLADVATDVEFGPTIELLGYHDLVGAAGFSQ